MFRAGPCLSSFTQEVEGSWIRVRGCCHQNHKQQLTTTVYSVLVWEARGLKSRGQQGLELSRLEGKILLGLFSSWGVPGVSHLLAVLLQPLHDLVPASLCSLFLGGPQSLLQWCGPVPGLGLCGPGQGSAGPALSCLVSVLQWVMVGWGKVWSELVDFLEVVTIEMRPRG